MKKQYFIISLFLISLSGFSQLTPPPELQSYYSNVDFNLTGNNLYNDLATETIAKHSPYLTYTQRHNYLYDADEDPGNASNVILVYSGESRNKNEYLSGSNQNPTQTFNTEHVYPKSLLDNSTSEADLHLLRTCDISVNSSRGNDPFTSGSGSYGSTGSAWYPGDDWRGDVARIILYVNLRYNESFTDVGSLSLFLQWNVDDPVSAIEDKRNTIISGAQGNRNPFIDNPYLATVIWGGTAAENRWDTLGVNDQLLESVTLYPNPAFGNTLHINTKEDISITIFNILGKQIFKKDISPNQNSVDISNLNSGLYLVKLKSENASIVKKFIKQ